MLLAEELLLLGLDPVEGAVVNNARQQLLVGLASALVGELALAGLVDLSGKRFIAVGRPPGTRCWRPRTRRWPSPQADGPQPSSAASTRRS
jgi:hypothetical protein